MKAFKMMIIWTIVSIKKRQRNEKQPQTGRKYLHFISDKNLYLRC